MAMKKPSKRLALATQTIRVLQSDDLGNVQGGTSVVIAPSGTSVIAPSTLHPSGGITSIRPGTSVIIIGH